MRWLCNLHSQQEHGRKAKKKVGMKKSSGIKKGRSAIEEAVRQKQLKKQVAAATAAAEAEAASGNAASGNAASGNAAGGGDDEAATSPTATAAFSAKGSIRGLDRVHFLRLHVKCKSFQILLRLTKCIRSKGI